MAKGNRKRLIEFLRTGDLAGVKAYLADDPEAARSAQVVCEAGRLAWKQALEVLLKYEADLNGEYRGYRPLHSMIQEKPHTQHEQPPASRITCLRWLLSKGADPEQLGGWPSTRAIITAAFVGEPDYVEELRKAGAVVDGFVSAALGDLRQVERLLAKNSDFAAARDPGGLTALQCAAGSRMGKRNKKTHDSLLEIGRLLLDHGADLKSRVKSWGHDVDTVYFAISSGQIELFELFLDRGADPTAALPAAAWKTDPAFADVALKHGAKIDDAIDNEKPLLNELIRWGQFKQAIWLLEHGANPDLADSDGWTALHQAASRGNENMFKALLAAKGDPSRKDKSGATVLDIAKAKGRSKLAALLEF